MTTELSETYKVVKHKAIVTARHDDMRDKIISIMDSFNLPQPNWGLFCYPKQSSDVERTADWKSRVIVNIIKNSEFKTVNFYDDNSKIVNSVTKKVNIELPHIIFNAIKYKY